MIDAEMPVLTHTREALAAGKEICVEDLQEWKKEMAKARNAYNPVL